MSDTLGRSDGFQPIAYVDEDGISYGIPRDVNGNPISGQGNAISTTSFNSRDAATLAASGSLLWKELF